MPAPKDIGHIWDGAESVAKMAILRWDTGTLAWVRFSGEAVGPAANVVVTNFPATQAVSGPLTDAQLRASAVPVSNASLPLPSGAATSTLQSTGNTSLTSIDAKLTNPLPVSGPLTDAQLRATAVPVSNTNLDVALSTRLKPADTLVGVTTVSAVTAITNALPAGTNLMGKVGIDLTTPGTTNKVALSDSIGQSQFNFPAGFVRVTDEPTQLFYDPFDSTIETANRWNTPVSAGGGVAASVTSGNLTLGTGTTANGYSTLATQHSFIPAVPGWLGVSHALKLEFPLTANTYRFWGQGSIPVTPTAAAPLTDAFGFEIATDGKLHAVVYIAGVRTSIADLSATGKQPVDANFHRYIVYYRTDKIFFYIDNLITPVATADFVSPAIQVLPHRFLAVAGSSAPASSGTITIAGVAIWDTGKNNHTLSDGVFGWRKATIKPASVSAATTDTALVVAVAPNNRATYRAASAVISLTALTTDYFSITGSATKTVRVLFTQTMFTGGSLVVNVHLVKRSTANTGASTTLTAVPCDSANPAATAVVQHYAVNPVTGTLVGAVASRKLASPSALTNVIPGEALVSFGDRPGQAIVLRGVNEVLAWNLLGTTGPTSAACGVEWTEENN